VPSEAINSLIIQQILSKEERCNFEKLSCPDCKKNIGYLFEDLSEALHSEKLKPLAFLKSKSLLVMD
jgi:hypothetical protein